MRLAAGASVLEGINWQSVASSPSESTMHNYPHPDALFALLRYSIPPAGMIRLWAALNEVQVPLADTRASLAHCTNAGRTSFPCEASMACEAQWV
jgi:hypothetical protein